MIEVLAPAGGVDSFKAAVLSGADAVYFGAGNFNAVETPRILQPKMCGSVSRLQG